MQDLYDVAESALIWGMVVFAVGLVFYLAYLQYLKLRRRRERRRHRERRAMRRQQSWSAEQHPPPDHSSQTIEGTAHS